jgi:hypothetical protein
MDFQCHLPVVVVVAKAKAEYWSKKLSDECDGAAVRSGGLE